MKRNAVLAILFLLAVFSLSACAPAASDGQAEEAPEFFNDIEKTLSELKNEHPEGEFVANPGGFPDSAAICFGEPEADFIFCFFGAQSGDAEKAMNEYEDQLKCAGFITTSDILFPDMEEDMSFEEFFSLLGVNEYEYFTGEEVAQGWLKFAYNGSEVMINTNEINASGGWDFTGEESVKRSAPASIIDPEIFKANQDLANTVMFD